MIILIMAATGLAVVVLASTGSSPSPARPRASLFAKFDRDGNGVATRAEVPAESQKQFEFLVARVGQSELGSLTEAQFERAIRSGGEPPRIGEPSSAAEERRNSSTVKAPRDERGTAAVEKRHGSQTTTPGTDTAAPLASAGGEESARAGGGRLASGDLSGPHGVLAASGATPWEDQAVKSADRAAHAATSISRTPGGASETPKDVAAAEIQVGLFQRRLFERLDANRDGVLSDAEIPEAFRAALISADASGDARLDPREFSRGIEMLSTASAVQSTGLADRRSKVRGGLVSRPGPDAPVAAYAPPVAPSPADAGLPGWFVERDKNRDHQVAQYEWPTTELAEFQRMDSNHDGFISRQEAVARRQDPTKSDLTSNPP